MIIPYEQISPDALEGLVEEYVTREGTEYGWDDIPLATKVAQVLQQVKMGEVIIVYDSDTQSCNIIPKQNASEITT